LPGGQHLLAHEVAHTVQQAGGAEMRQNKLEVSAPDDAHEVEADRAASAMVAGQPTTVSTTTHGGVSRVWDQVQSLWGEAQELFGWGVEGDIEVQRAKQDLAIAQEQLAAAQEAARSSASKRDQAKVTLEAAKAHHLQVAGDGASKVPGTEANSRLAAAEKRTQAAEQAFEIADRAAERTAEELDAAERNEPLMYANLVQARLDAERRIEAARRARRGPEGAAEDIRESIE
jgi:hypothetical protein